MNITGMSGVIQSAFALTEPKIKPAYPCRKHATGIPTPARTLMAFSSFFSDSSLISYTPSVNAQKMRYFIHSMRFLSCFSFSGKEISTKCFLYRNHNSDATIAP